MYGTLFNFPIRFTYLLSDHSDGRLIWAFYNILFRYSNHVPCCSLFYLSPPDSYSCAKQNTVVNIQQTIFSVHFDSSILGRKILGTITSILIHRRFIVTQQFFQVILDKNKHILIFLEVSFLNFSKSLKMAKNDDFEILSNIIWKLNLYSEKHRCTRMLLQKWVPHLIDILLSKLFWPTVKKVRKNNDVNKFCRKTLSNV